MVDWCIVTSCRLAPPVPGICTDPLSVPTYVALLSGSVREDDLVNVPVGLSSTMFGHYFRHLACIPHRPEERARPAVKISMLAITST